jgi:hypothetical protein
MKIPPTEEALQWAAQKTFSLAAGQDTTQTTIYVALLLKYIHELEKTAHKGAILRWKPFSQETNASSSTPHSPD